MARFKYKEGYLYCKTCETHYKIEDCEMFYSPGRAGMKWRICPKGCSKWKLRSGSHNKRWKEYFDRVIKPQMAKEREEYQQLTVIRKPHHAKM